MDKYLISPRNLISQRNDLKTTINRRSLTLSSAKKNKFSTPKSSSKLKRYSIAVTSSVEFQNDNYSIVNSRDVLLKKYFGINDSAKSNDVSSDTRLSSKINHSEMSLLVDNIENISPASPLARSLSQLTMENSPTEACKTNMYINPITPKQYPCFDKIKRDLNSPSATVRLRALHALKSPSKIQNYYGYDVPAEEIDIITEEERKSPEKPKSIQEIMKEVIVYIEVRNGVDNRSAGIKNIMFMLGATVNDKLLRNTTHVIFKDGLLSTYNKAKRWNIPLVSILWVEACKKFKRMMNPKYYPISDIDKYENPDLKKIRKYKSMQPDVDNIIKSGNQIVNQKNNKISELENEGSDDFDEDDDVFQPESAKKINRKNILDDTIKNCDDMIKSISNNLEHLSQKSDASDTSSGIFVKDSDKTDNITSSRMNLGDDSNVTIRRSRRTSSISSSILNRDCSTPLQSKTPITNHKTMYDITMDISMDKTLKYDDSANKTNYNVHSMDESYKPVISIPTSVNRRRTLFTPNYSGLDMDASSATASSTSKNIIRRRTLIGLPKPSSKLDIFNPHDETNKTIEEPPLPTSCVKRRRTLYTPQSYSIEITENTDLEQVDSESKKNKEKELSKLIADRKKLRRSLFPSNSSSITSSINDKCNNSKETIDGKTNPTVPPTSLLSLPATGAIKKRQLFTSGSYNDVPSLEKSFKAATPQKPKTPLSKIKTTARRSTLEFELNKPKNPTHHPATQTQATLFTANRKREQVMVVTNMHKNEIDVVKEAIKKLGRFKLEQTVTDRTTHLVSFEPRRTINMLRGIIRGVWILNFNWIIDSITSKHWLREEFYELKDFSKAVQLCRTERQAFEGNYKIDLFQDIEPIFISNKSTVPVHYLRELIRSCSGRYTDNVMKARYVVGEKLHNENVMCLNPLWILDSIQENKILKISKYVLR